MQDSNAREEKEIKIDKEKVNKILKQRSNGVKPIQVIVEKEEDARN